MAKKQSLQKVWVHGKKYFIVFLTLNIENFLTLSFQHRHGIWRFSGVFSDFYTIDVLAI